MNQFESSCVFPHHILRRIGNGNDSIHRSDVAQCDDPFDHGRDAQSVCDVAIPLLPQNGAGNSE